MTDRENKEGKEGRKTSKKLSQRKSRGRLRRERKRKAILGGPEKGKLSREIRDLWREIEGGKAEEEEEWRRRRARRQRATERNTTSFQLSHITWRAATGRDFLLMALPETTMFLIKFNNNNNNHN